MFFLTFFRFCALACLFVFWFHGTRAAPTRRLSIAISHFDHSSMIDLNFIRPYRGRYPPKWGFSPVSHTCKLTARHKRVAHSTEREKRARMNATTHVMEQRQNDDRTLVTKFSSICGAQTDRLPRLCGVLLQQRFSL